MPRPRQMQSRKLRSKKTTCSRFLQLPAEVQVKIFQSCLDLSYDIHITKASELPNSKLDVTYMARVGENEYNAIWHKGSSKPSSDLQILRLSRKIYPQARQSLTDCFSGNIFVNHHIIGHEKAEKSEWYDELIHAAGVPGEKITTLTLETGKLWHHDTTLNLQDWNAFGEFFDFTKLPKLQKVNLSLPFFGYPYEGYSHEVMNVTCDEDEATGKEMLGDKYDRRIIKFAAAKLPWTPSTTAHEIRSPDGTVVEIGLYGRLRNEPLAPYTDRRLDDLFNSRPDVVVIFAMTKPGSLKVLKKSIIETNTLYFVPGHEPDDSKEFQSRAIEMVHLDYEVQPQETVCDRPGCCNLE